MKIVCDREKLLSAFQIAAAVAPARSPKVILQNVKLDVQENSTVMMATDMEISIRVDVEGVQVETPGAAILPIQRFGSILREVNDAQLRLEVDGGGALVRGERSEFKLLAPNPEEFPPVGAFNESKYHELPGRLLREMIRRTVFATDTESSRYALGGVLLEMEEEKITAVGTDGRRLARMEGPAKGVAGHKTGDTTTIVPSRAMQLMERTLADNPDEARISVRGNEVVLKTNRATISSRLVEGRFPKWRDVFPRREDVAKIEMVAGPTYSAVRQAAIVTSDESRGVDLSFADGKLVLAGRAAERGQARIELPIPYEGKPVAIMLDPRYVSDFLKVLDPETTFTMELKDSESAAVCTTTDGYGYVIMPLARDR